MAIAIISNMNNERLHARHNKKNVAYFLFTLHCHFFVPLLHGSSSSPNKMLLARPLNSLGTWDLRFRLRLAPLLQPASLRKVRVSI